MYQDFYLLKEKPFNVTADPDFFFQSPSHQEAIASLRYGVAARKGIMLVTGEIGTGKTTLCRRLVRELDGSNRFAIIFNPKCSDAQLLQMILQDLGINPKQRNQFGYINALNHFLIEQYRAGNNVIILIDEAQHLSVNQLEQVRLLSNLETEKDKLLQILLIGQPELQQKLQLPALRQLRQRITIHYELTALTAQDVGNYIRHRLEQAANPLANGVAVTFSEQAVRKLYAYSQGSPRTINILCDLALLAGFAAEKRVIDEYMIDNCAKEVIYCEHNL